MDQTDILIDCAFLLNMCASGPGHVVQTGPWKITRARVKHVDDFGATINPQEDYLSRETGRGFDQRRKVSIQSAIVLRQLFIDDNGLAQALSQSQTADQQLLASQFRRLTLSFVGEEGGE